MADITKFDDIIDIRDVIARVEELESERDALQDAQDEAQEAYDFHDSDDTQTTPEWSELQKARAERAAWNESEESAELQTLVAFLDECKGRGGDEQWRGDWYPVTAIRESYFVNYAQELAEDIGAIPKDAQWPCTCIDWEQAARELQMDYTGADFDGVTYYVR